MNTDSFIFECTIEKFSKKELGAGPGRLLLLGNIWMSRLGRMSLRIFMMRLISWRLELILCE